MRLRKLEVITWNKRKSCRKKSYRKEAVMNWKKHYEIREIRKAAFQNDCLIKL